MPTSKLPVRWVDVSARLSTFAGVNPGVHCNLRITQRPPLQGDERILGAFYDGVHVAPIKHMLQELPLPVKVAIHFQGYGVRVGTAVVQLANIYWADGGDYPRLDFEHPKGMEWIFGCPSFWGAFILAIAEIGPSAPAFARPDPEATTFMRIIKRYPPEPRPAMVRLVRKGTMQVFAATTEIDPANDGQIAAWLSSQRLVLMGDGKIMQDAISTLLATDLVLQRIPSNYF